MHCATKGLVIQRRSSSGPLSPGSTKKDADEVDAGTRLLHRAAADTLRPAVQTHAPAGDGLQRSQVLRRLSSLAPYPVLEQPEAVRAEPELPLLRASAQVDLAETVRLR